MEKDDKYSAEAEAAEAGAEGRSFLDANLGGYLSCTSSDPNHNYNPIYHHHHDEVIMKVAGDHVIDDHNNNNTSHGRGITVDYMLKNAPPPLNEMMMMMIPPHGHGYDRHHHQPTQQPQLHQEPNNDSLSMYGTAGATAAGMSSAVERTLSFADVMQFADFGHKLALNHIPDDDLIPHGQQHHQSQPQGQSAYVHQSIAEAANQQQPVQLEFLGVATTASTSTDRRDDQENLFDNSNNYVVSDDKVSGHTNIIINMEGEEGGGISGGVAADGKSTGAGTTKRKRPRTIKTSEEVESQRMTHIAVERNRRKQMNEHLRVLRSLMPSSYVQRGDQASIIGGAIEFVRELEQLLQCLESQKRRRLYGDQAQAQPIGDSSSSAQAVALNHQQPLGFPASSSQQEDDQLRLAGDRIQLDPNSNSATTPVFQEETAESKSCIADVQVKVLGFDALIKILSRRHPGQLIKAIAALEDLHFTIIHTNITTIEQMVLYSFNVRVASEARYTADDIASSVQQIFSFIHANTNII